MQMEGSDFVSEHSFTLILDGDVEAHLDELFEAGCDDATFGSVDGVSYAEFDREAETLADAVRSALEAIAGVDGLGVRRVEPDDLVTASEIAKRLGRSRESVRLLAAGKRGDGSFPAPVTHALERNRLWHWADLLEWADKGSERERGEARFIAALNAGLERASRTPRLTPGEEVAVQLAERHAEERAMARARAGLVLATTTAEERHE
jgi:hypothetical protein